MVFVLDSRLWLCIDACVIALVYALVRRMRTRPRYPPGPPGYPLIGNILEVSPEGGWLKYTAYKETYGDLVFFHGLGNSVLVLNSLDAITALFEQKAHIYSDRPAFTLAGELMGLDQCVVLQPYGAEWRAQRKLAHYALSPRAVRQYCATQEDLAVLLAAQLLDAPHDVRSLVRLTASRLVLAITYGLSVETADDEYIADAEAVVELCNRSMVPGAFLCDLLPFLKHLPAWMPFHRTARRGKAMVDAFVSKPLAHVQTEMANGTAPPSLAHDLLLLPAEDAAAHAHSVKWTTGTLYAAAGDTTVATVLTLLRALAQHPAALARAHAELDAAVGRARLPRVADRPALPYVTAVIREAVRWHPALPLGIARKTAKEDTHAGYTIPKNTIVLPNVYALARARVGRHDPAAFAPERFLADDPAELPPDPLEYGFGFARRQCPGKHLAENSLFAIVATLLAVFDVAPGPGDGAGEQPKFTTGLISYPEDFACVLTPRSAAAAALVRERAGMCAV